MTKYYMLLEMALSGRVVSVHYLGGKFTINKYEYVYHNFMRLGDEASIIHYSDKDIMNVGYTVASLRNFL